MSRAFADITFTPSVKAAQTHYRTRGANEGYEGADDPQNELTEHEREFIQQSDGFYQATVKLAAETLGLDAGAIRFERFAAPPALNDDRVFEIDVD